MSHGQSISSISRSQDRRAKGGVQRIVSVHGGIAPPARSRAAWTLELGEREEISRGIAAGLAIRAIARSLGRSPSTICREIAVHKRIVQPELTSGLGARAPPETVSPGTF